MSIKLRFPFFFTPLDEGQNARQMEKSNPFDPSRLANGDGADEISARPFVKLRSGAPGIEFMPALGCPNPDRQNAFPFGHPFRQISRHVG